MTIRIVFMGSPAFAVPALRAVNEIYPVVGVVTQPDRPAGRGRSLISPPIKTVAQELGLPFIQPKKLRDTDTMDTLRNWEPQLIIVAAFGQILRPDVLALPAFGCLNVHASLLPRWRGAAPIQAAILHGDSQTGITIMRMDAGIDTGDIISQKAEPIYSDDTANVLSDRLSRLGASLLIQTLPKYMSGEMTPFSQNDDFATYAPMLKKEDGKLDFGKPVSLLSNQVRAYHPWPSAYTTLDNQLLKILAATSVSYNNVLDLKPVPGERTRLNGKPAIGTSDGFLILEIVQPAGKKPMSGQAFLLGAQNWD